MIIDQAPESIETLAVPGATQRAEGIAFAPSGDVIAVATADANSVLLFRRKPKHRRFDPTPYCSIAGGASRINYPHDVSFAHIAGREYLAVAQRMGSIALYRKRDRDDIYDSEPTFEIRGPKARLQLSDGVAFVPPANHYLAACNLGTATISFYRKRRAARLSFDDSPRLELRDRSLGHPDGLAFTSCGRWLAVANHGNHSVTVFARVNPLRCKGRLRYEPQVVIRHSALRHPHSVAFTPLTNHLLVTNAGANYFSVFAPVKGARTWSTVPLLHQRVGAEDHFREINSANKMEGGPKGVAIHGDTIAICSPELGVKLYRFRESH